MSWRKDMICEQEKPSEGGLTDFAVHSIWVHLTLHYLNTWKSPIALHIIFYIFLLRNTTIREVKVGVLVREKIRAWLLVRLIGQLWVIYIIYKLPIHSCPISFVFNFSVYGMYPCFSLEVFNQRCGAAREEVIDLP